MGILDFLKPDLTVFFSDWIKVNDKYSAWTIEDFQYKAEKDKVLTTEEKEAKLGIPKDGVDNHCWKCVTVNNCWFKNEENKKPEYFDYTDYSYKQIAKINRGLYHPHCHCKEKAINVPKLKDISIIDFNNKIKDFFNRKIDWFYKWGYSNKDKEEFEKTFHSLIIENYRYGNYIKEKHTRFGYQINIFIQIRDKKETTNIVYHNIKSAYIIYPNGKLRCVTLVGGEK